MPFPAIWHVNFKQKLTAKTSKKMAKLIIFFNSGVGQSKLANTQQARV
jgi:hypothetical protein